MTSGRDEYLERTRKHIDYEAEAKRREWWLNNTGGQASAGLTVRDYFAAKALQGGLHADVIERLQDESLEVYFEAYATFAYSIADAMMKERAK